MRIVLATRNPHKTREFTELLGPGFQVADLSGENVPEIEETGRTFEENATIKALAVSRLHLDAVVVADDSGLEVEALNGDPGVLSARYAGSHATDRQNTEKLLRELEEKAPLRRLARFGCVIAIARQGKLVQLITGEVWGTIAKSAQGKNGFGYDPVFVPEGFRQTFAELLPEVKNRISHRAQAAKKLRQFLAGN